MKCFGNYRFFKTLDRINMLTETFCTVFAKSRPKKTFAESVVGTGDHSEYRDPVAKLKVVVYPNRIVEPIQYKRQADR